MNLVRLIAVCITLSVFYTSAHAKHHEGTALDAITADARFAQFSAAIENSGLKKLFSKDSTVARTIYVPTDDAFGNLPPEIRSALANTGNTTAAQKLVRTHYFMGTLEPLAEGQAMTSVNIDGNLVRIYQAKDLFVKDMVVRNEAIKVGNTTIIPTDCVMFLQASSTDFRLTPEDREKFPITTCCLRTDAEVAQFLKGLDY